MNALQNMYIAALLFSTLGYLSGSLSFALWVTRLTKGVDVREVGSKHATTTNTIRQAGWAAGATVLLLDLAKGFLPVYLAKTLGAADWVVGLTAAAAVAGHCWPLFTGFRGGMGLAALGGGYLALSLPAFLVVFGLLVTLTVTTKHGARASVAAGLFSTPILIALKMSGAVLWVAGLGGLVVALRFLIDWKREYREVWLDREKPE